MEPKIIQLPGDENINKLVFTIDNFLSDKECNNFLKLINNNDFQMAPIGDKNKSIESETRNNSRTFLDDEKIIENLWNKIKIIDLIPKTMTNNVFKLKGLFKNLLFYKYNVGEYFKEHYDGDKIDGNKKSFFTLLIYLNDDFEGGETNFIHYDRKIIKKKLKQDKILTPIIPKKGQLLIFKHNILHEGCIIKSGEKLVLRSDIMYEKNK